MLNNIISLQSPRDLLGLAVWLASAVVFYGMLRTYRRSQVAGKNDPDKKMIWGKGRPAFHWVISVCSLLNALCYIGLGLAQSDIIFLAFGAAFAVISLFLALQYWRSPLPRLIELAVICSVLLFIYVVFIQLEKSSRFTLLLEGTSVTIYCFSVTVGRLLQIFRNHKDGSSGCDRLIWQPVVLFNALLAVYHILGLSTIWNLAAAIANAIGVITAGIIVWQINFNPNPKYSNELAFKKT